MTITYDDKTPRHFMIASIVWGIVGMLVGVIIATQMSDWRMNGAFLEAITCEKTWIRRRFSSW